MQTITARELRHIADRIEQGFTLENQGPVVLRGAAHTIDQLRDALNKALFDAAEMRGRLADPAFLELVPRQVHDDAIRTLKAVEEERDNLRHEVDQMAAEIRRRPSLKGVTLDVPPGTRIAIELP